jgi:predicted NUDIX family NTP pyrophosphohydrolase
LNPRRAGGYGGAGANRMPTRKTSAGLLLYRRTATGVEVFLVHPGGPFYRGRDDGVWSIPKGEIDDPDEDPLAVARREFEEETGRAVADCAATGDFLPLGEIVQRGGKRVVAWAFEGDWPPGLAPRSNTFTLEWPPRSGRTAAFPEIDRAELFPLTVARSKIHPDQAALIDRLLALPGVADEAR